MVPSQERAQQQLSAVLESRRIASLAAVQQVPTVRSVKAASAASPTLARVYEVTSTAGESPTRGECTEDKYSILR